MTQKRVTEREFDSWKELKEAIIMAYKRPGATVLLSDSIDIPYDMEKKMMEVGVKPTCWKGWNVVISLGVEEKTVFYEQPEDPQEIFFYSF